MTNLSKSQVFYEILNFHLVILTIFLQEIWPLFGLFSFFRIWPFLKLLMAKFGLFNFLRPDNPELDFFVKVFGVVIVIVSKTN